MDPNSPSQYPPSANSPYGAPNSGPGAADPRVRNLAIALLALSVVLLIGVITKSWIAESKGGMSVGAGLLGVEVSAGERSESQSWGDMKDKAPGGQAILGYLGLLGGLATIAGAVAMGVFALTNKPNKVPVKALLGVAVATAIIFVIFLVRLMTADGTKELGISYSGILAIAATVGIAVVAKKLHELRYGRAGY